MRKVKLIWEFFGKDAQRTAEHHAVHLAEFSKKEELSFFEYGTDLSNDLSIAYLIVEESKMIMVRDALKPKRGEWVD